MRYSPMFTKHQSPNYFNSTNDLFNSIFQSKIENVDIPVEAYSYNDKYVVYYYLCLNKENAIEKKDIEITIEKSNFLSVSVERKETKNKPIVSSFKYGKLKSVLQFPQCENINIKDISASYNEGVLVIELKKRPSLEKVIIN